MTQDTEENENGQNVTDLQKSKVNKILSTVMYLWAGVWTIVGLYTAFSGDLEVTGYFWNMSWAALPNGIIAGLMTFSGLIVIPSLRPIMLGIEKDSHITAIVVSLIFLWIAFKFM